MDSYPERHDILFIGFFQQDGTNIKASRAIKAPRALRFPHLYFKRAYLPIIKPRSILLRGFIMLGIFQQKI